MSEVSLSP